MEYLDFMIYILTIFLFIFLSIFIKKRKLIILIIACIVLGIEFFIYQSQYKTFAELYPQVANENHTVDTITISEYEEVDGYPVVKNEIKVKDQVMIDHIINELADRKYKLETEPKKSFHKYEIEFETKREIKENYYKYDYVTTFFTEHEVLSDSEHLKTIKSLIESEE